MQTVRDLWDPLTSQVGRMEGPSPASGHRLEATAGGCAAAARAPRPAGVLATGTAAPATRPSPPTHPGLGAAVARYQLGFLWRSCTGPFTGEEPEARGCKGLSGGSLITLVDIYRVGRTRSYPKPLPHEGSPVAYNSPE